MQNPFASLKRTAPGAIGPVGLVFATLLLSPACATEDDPRRTGVGGGSSSSSEASPSSASSGGSSSAESSSSGGACAPGSTVSCYDGPPDTVDVGNCIAGTQTCTDDGIGYGPCTGQVLPAAEDCGTPGDEECDGAPCGDTLWAIEEGDADHQALAGVATDSGGNVISVGNFQGTLDLGNGAAANAGSSHETPFVAKMSPDGTAAWLKKIDGNDSSSQSIGHVAIDDNDAIVLSGYYSGHLTIDALTVVASSNAFDLFVAKLAPDGNALWLRQGAADTFASVDAMTILPDSGDVVVSGYYCGTLSLGGAASPLFFSCGPVPNGHAGFLARFDAATGDAKFALDLGAGVRPFGLAASPLGDLIVSGTAESEGTPTTFAAPPLSATSNDSGATAFVARLLGDGTGLWIKMMGEEGANSNIWRVAVDSNDDIALVAEYDGIIDFGGITLAAPGDGAAFWGAAKLQGDGTVAWTKNFTVNASFEFGYAQYPSLAVDKDDAIVVAGPLEGSVSFDGVQWLSSVDSQDMFVAKLASDGQHVWSRRFGTPEIDFLYTVAVDPNAAVLIGGNAWQPIDLGTGLLTYSGTADVILAKIAP
ncbi:MAG: hypothetical protein WKG00_04720 [Polyangiaceae bacterium]